jgi:xanthine/CO dehydrogenase XdhC/CoxF family maturation factor
VEKPGLAVLAIGGNALIRDRKHESIPDQYEMVCAIAEIICGMLEGGWKVVVTHGNGPQVGFILRRSELSIAEVPPVPMDYAGADIQGAVGYMFVKALRNAFRRHAIKREAVAVVTQTVVDRNDPAFANPERFPDADATLAMAYTRVGEAFDFGQDDYVVLMTRGHASDHTILEQIYDCPARYLGMLGSKPRIAKIWQYLEARGIARQWLDRVHAPIGLNIHARSPEEISISILAELIHVRRTSPVVIPQRQRLSL